ncbi:MAG: hypothetical protein A2W31_01450 [Planctomycetes bacterium RBG_16_64_10]|nr:MAG: hypothetical protein A2W31_01450 [Planctomycetes bacterium RBG_16_64_10]
MTPEFAKRIDPVFLRVLDLLDRLSRGQNPPPRDEQTQIRRCLDAAEAALGQTDEWLLAKYALVAWVDEVLIEAPWEGRTWWEQNALEWELFQTADAYEKYFDKAVEASRLPAAKRDALEVFYVGVVLGFRGLYRDPSGAAAEQAGLPSNLESWARETAQAILLGLGRPSIPRGDRSVQGAPPLEARFTFVGVTLIGVILAVAAVIVGLVKTAS